MAATDPIGLGGSSDLPKITATRRTMELELTHETNHLHHCGVTKRPSIENVTICPGLDPKKAPPTPTPM